MTRAPKLQNTCTRSSGRSCSHRNPGRDQLRIDLHGGLTGILQIASQKQVRPGNTLDSGPNKIALVAGAGFIRHLQLMTAIDIAAVPPT